MTITVLRNARKRNTVFWPVTQGRVMAIAPGEQFAVDDSELDAPGLRAALNALIDIGWLVIEAEGLQPVRH